MKNSAGVAVVVVSPQEDDCSAINKALRDAGHVARCTHLNDAGDLTATVASLYPDLIVLFADDQEVIDRSIRACKVGDVELPLLLAGGTVSEDSIAATMLAGARDHISLDNISRLQSVAGRELRNSQLEKSLEQVMNSARQFKNELHTLKQVSVEAIADVQEGIIVNTNPAWLELFGFPEDSDLMGTPVMDLCNKTDQPALKGGIVACQRGKWQDDVLEISGVSHDGEEFQVQFCLENAEHDGCPAVRMIVKPDTSENKTPVSLLEKSLQRDHVTGFFNRQHFADVAADRITEIPDGGSRSIAYIRIDHFSRAAKDIGIIGTDSIIAQFAQLLRSFTQPTDIYGRFGGTMFAVMLERGTMEDAEAWAGNFLTAVSEAVFEHDKRSTVLTCSIGLCELDSAEMTFESALGDAERAGESARQHGGDRVALSEASGAAKQVRQDDSVWVPRIRDALMDNRFRLEHQPVAGLNHEINDAYDILVRMLDEEGNTVLPSEFMPVAERTGMTKNIDRWVIGASLSFCLTNRAELLFVRLSRDSLLDETLTPWLMSQLERSQVTPNRICFEVEERVASEHLAQTIALAGALRDTGFRFAIEHFGKSPDAKQLLSRIPLDLIKIDGSLMQGLHKDAGSQERVKDLACAADEAGVRTVAERVQDANTMAVLWQLGVSYIQGNYIQKRDIVLEDTSQSSVTTRALQMQS
ncbi:MAG: EAL domain-containing protein [Gammaproteobacteria bacterium]|nr:EAL domain-containing protein [Gammaproteobacteria bacterium]NND53639.1 EAL domain-containing protein [Gammaproteobacteria bacterium]